MKNVWFGSGFLHLILTLIHQQYYDVLTTLTTFVREISSKSSYFYGLVIGSWLFLTYFKQYFDTIIMMVVPSCLKEMNTSTLAKKSLKYVFEVNYGDCSNWRHMTPSFYLTSLFIWRPLDVIKSRWIKLIYLVLRTSHTKNQLHISYLRGKTSRWSFWPPPQPSETDREGEDPNNAISRTVVKLKNINGYCKPLTSTENRPPW